MGDIAGLAGGRVASSRTGFTVVVTSLRPILTVRSEIGPSYFLMLSVVVWRSGTVDTKDPGAGGFPIGEVLVKKERSGRFGKRLHDLGDLEAGRRLRSGPV